MVMRRRSRRSIYVWLATVRYGPCPAGEFRPLLLPPGKWSPRLRVLGWQSTCCTDGLSGCFRSPGRSSETGAPSGGRVAHATAAGCFFARTAPISVIQSYFVYSLAHRRSRAAGLGTLQTRRERLAMAFLPLLVMMAVIQE